jgi:hypothetical protein
MWLPTTAERLGLWSSKRDLKGLMTISERGVAPVDVSCSLSIPLVPGWLVSGKKNRMDKKITTPIKAKTSCIMRQDV